MLSDADPVIPAFTLTGSLNTICSCNPNRAQLWVVVVNCGGCDTSAFVTKLLKSAGSTANTDHSMRSISFESADGAKTINLIEVDSEKHDLWTSLNIDGCMLLFSPSNAQSFKHASEKLKANATAIENGARYWEVVKDGKTERSPLTYNQIVSQMVCIFGDVQLERTPQKITFHFNAQEVQKPKYANTVRQHLKGREPR
uniref:Uncharacterized protein n=1 Tax=Ascaris lumbricoides TaxID=6252 RepID=A0A9J2PL13_ASCLU